MCLFDLLKCVSVCCLIGSVCVWERECVFVQLCTVCVYVCVTYYKLAVDERLVYSSHQLKRQGCYRTMPIHGLTPSQLPACSFLWDLCHVVSSSNLSTSSSGPPLPLYQTRPCLCRSHILLLRPRRTVYSFSTVICP